MYDDTDKIISRGTIIPLVNQEGRTGDIPEQVPNEFVITQIPKSLPPQPPVIETPVTVSQPTVSTTITTTTTQQDKGSPEAVGTPNTSVPTVVDSVIIPPAVVLDIPIATIPITTPPAKTPKNISITVDDLLVAKDK